MATINGSNNDDVLTGTAQADTIRGLAGADEIDGGYGDDWIEGGDGDDTLFGGYGTDTLVGGAGDDTYYIDLGSATDRVSEQRDGGFDIVISESSYTLSGNVEGLYLLGGSKGVGNSIQNVILGNDGSNALYGMGGDDGLKGGLGNDQLYGGRGRDEVYGDAGNDTVYAEAGDVVAGEIYDGGDGTDTFRFSTYGYVPKADLTGVVFRNMENLISYADVTFISQQTARGFDSIQTEFIGLTEGGSVNLRGIASLDIKGIQLSDLGNILKVANFESSLGAYDFLTIRGGKAADQITGGATGWTIIDGGGGDDIITAGAGRARLIGGHGVDKVTGSNGTDAFDIATGSDIAAGEVYDGKGGNDIFEVTSESYDEVRFDLRKVTVVNIETLETYGVNLALTPESLAPFDNIHAGDLRFITGGRIDLWDKAELDIGYVFLSDRGNIFDLRGPSGPQAELSVLWMHGGAKADTIIGAGEIMYVFAGDGDDIIDGGAGNDVLQGQGGADTFVFQAGHGQDHIGDFERGFDKIDVRAFGYHSLDDLYAAGGSIGAASYSPYAVEVKLSAGSDSIDVSSATPQIMTLDASDFIFA